MSDTSILFILNDPPYGSERTYNGLRLACEVGLCGSCMDARGMSERKLTGEAHRGSLDELANWVEAAERTLVY